jgi:uroporphyrinogen-III synthase
MNLNKGKVKILTLRPDDQKSWCDQLNALGYTAENVSITQTVKNNFEENLKNIITNQEDFTIVITSKNTFKYLYKFSLENQSFTKKQLIVISEKLKEFAINFGFEEVTVSEQSYSLNIAENIKNTTKFYIILGAKEPSLDWSNYLNSDKYSYIQIYTTVKRELNSFESEILLQNHDYVLFTNPKSVQLLEEMYWEKLKQSKIVSIGNTTSEEIKKIGFQDFIVLEKPTIDSFLDVIKNKQALANEY